MIVALVAQMIRLALVIIVNVSDIENKSLFPIEFQNSNSEPIPDLNVRGQRDGGVRCCCFDSTVDFSFYEGTYTLINADYY